MGLRLEKNIVEEKSGLNNGLEYEVNIRWQDLVENPQCVNWLTIMLDVDEKILSIKEPILVCIRVDVF